MNLGVVAALLLLEARCVETMKVAPTKGGAPCATAMDCNLGGLCDGGACRCFPQWTRPDCGAIHLLPNEGPSGFYHRDASSWGGSIVRGGDGLFHMFVSRITYECGIRSWYPNSEVVHAVSEVGTGPYAYADTVVGRFAHNPTAHRVGDRYALFHTGCGAGGARVRGCARGTTPPEMLKTTAAKVDHA